MPNKLLDTRLLPFLNQRIVTLFQNGGVFTQEEQEAMLIDVKNIRTALKVPEVSSFVAVGRNGANGNANINGGAYYCPTLVFGSGDSQVAIFVDYNFMESNETGIFLLTGANGWEARHCHIAKTAWVKKYIEDQKATIQDIENLFS